MASDAVVAIDVGGTGIKAALVAGDGTAWQHQRHPTRPDRGAGAVVETILRVADGLASAARTGGAAPRAAGVVVPGVVDEPAGVAVWSSNLGFRDVPLREQVAAHLGLPTALGHDVRAGGVAEARLGAGRGARHVLFVAIGTGIAAANVVDGQVDPGAHGAAGEIGHVVVRAGRGDAAPPCACGGRGCLEAVASAAAVQRRYAQLTGGSADAAQPADAARISAAVAAADETATRVWRETVEALADGLVLGQALFDAEVIVIGGGLAAAGELLLAPLRIAVKERLTIQREPRLVRAALGDEAGTIGAGLLAWDRLVEA